ncbi:class GN sortase [Simiduia agarivorans]|uniref:Transpeptidase family protein n=1 Tax=Simiduia agarivorans (strain DSM 21679 / JCM 13881 / BCRC 17597 / SA1) TaxID=1117647 RepID=K4KRK9_SIMAS|nr:class GN sortase [Simiduia agarivorans]AFV00931.1 putative transpeptidase family protein [Simiduia agarivorans SA1 = DSM 21679]
MRKLAIALCCACALISFSQAGWIHAKAWLAQVLIAEAWASSLASQGQAVRPWAWADTYPVAKLALPNGRELMVLNGGQGNALAFGPGLVEGSDPLGQGYSVVGGHRDTHFADLQHLQTGQAFSIQGLDGRWYRYQVSRVGAVDIHAEPLARQHADKVVLVTCYPFTGASANPDQRWVVEGDLIRL